MTGKYRQLFLYFFIKDAFFFCGHPGGATQHRLVAPVADCGFAAAHAYLPCAVPVYVVPRHNKRKKIYGAINDLIFFHRVSPSHTAVYARHHF